MMGLISLLAVALFAALAVSSMTPQASARDKNCSDFSSQRQAQHWFHKHHPHRDPAGLDADNDGRACEDNSCPCTNKRWKAGADTLTASRPQVFVLRGGTGVTQS